MFKQVLFFIVIGLITMSCCTNTTENKSTQIFTGEVERLGIGIDEIIPEGAKIEIIAEGFSWSEGPLWLGNEQKLIFTDVPANVIYQWTEKDSLEIYLEPAGLTGTDPNTGNSGGNGLLLDEGGNLIICQHGDRRIAKMLAPTSNPEPKFETLTAGFEGKRFNSPNDAVYDMHGNLYFTDPPYGLKDGDNDSSKEISFNGVYRLTTNGTLTLLTGELTRPNGIALSPDSRKLYIANSDPEKCFWMVYDLIEDGTIENGKVFFNATPLFNGENGLADGMKVDKHGNIFATGPGGVLIFSPDGKHLGTIKTGHATANCAFNDDESILYMTAHNYLMRIKLN